MNLGSDYEPPVKNKKAAVTATGFAGFFAYCLGAVLAGAPLGAIIKNYG
ncbi:hypothetical protein LWH96_05110 [Legionella sp. 9fVS26]|uniref:MFS transporter n=1 Tax=Legionella resiliens TaxID=2905958 RepID=A0ABS8WZ46_9GAMM|nr:MULTISPECIES: hypothetical protein [unclassified Legionella]MCE0722600.1 hypothetical protein [Legionella sp. 9fVS26]MCE3531753.1 hypothetical protein [Legionella sp. 8cVS16]